MLARRQWIAGACTLATARPTWSAEPIEVLTADVRPLSIADGPRRGIVLEVGTATVGRMQEALAERQRSGAIERVHRSYVQG